ncbi:polysaccharide biosynthesis C-terminal domain-containing protein [Stappia taiwanensis]|uniref:Polysaccharide biosynthesis C-terminal domain-containing protein n=1 Tax=Stappia taiwanensis TaxID=992267 RepID=A0A838XRG3_9HYPH|nr:polysaccharide biosynthesis C-terminal domain-containing protein [Stappia taiwanensis]MBA4611268.1 polysaccharide biosynthesis C-terminal domain-containing protein [Stappia taiwanensis]GGE87254.1 hypothetical protein GCM10007285_13600 [Stappia taiwanensis]
MLAILTRLSVLTLARIGGAGAVLLATLVIARGFGADATAAYALAVSASGVLAVLMLAGFQAFAQILTAEYAARGQDGLLRGLVRAGLRNLLLACLPVGAGALLVLGMPDAVPGLSAGALRTQVVLAVCLIAPGVALTLFNGAVLTGLQRPGEAQIADSLGRPLLILSFVALLALAAPGASAGWILAGLAVAVWSAAAVQGYFLCRALRARPAPAVSDSRRWWSMAPPWLTIALIWEYVIELHLLLASLIAAPAEIALLHVCFRFRVLAGFGVRSIYLVFQPKILAAQAREDRAAARHLIGLTNGLSVGYALAAFAGLWLVGPFFLSLFGPEFAGGLPLLLVLCGTFLLRAVFGPALSVLSGAGRQREIVVILVLSLPLSAGLMFALYPALGIVAAGIAYTASTGFAAGAMWWTARRRLGIDCAVWGARAG